MAFDYEPHPRTDRETLAGPPKTVDAAIELRGNGVFARFNRRVGLTVTMAVGTMWCAYLFGLLALVSAPSSFSSGDPIIVVAWIAQTFLQLTLLPIIIVGQNIQAKAADLRAESTYKDAEAILYEMQELQKHLAVQDERIKLILQQLKGD